MRDIAIALLFLVAATLLFPKVEEIVQRPFLRLTRAPEATSAADCYSERASASSSCPAQARCSRRSPLSAQRRRWERAVVLTLAYAIGAAIPMLFIAFGGRAAMTALRPHAHRIRQGLGVVVGLTALAIALNVDRHFQTAVPGYTEALQSRVEQNDWLSARQKASVTRANKRRAPR